MIWIGFILTAAIAFGTMTIGWTSDDEYHDDQMSAIDAEKQQRISDWIESNNLHYINDKYLTPEQRLELARTEMTTIDYYRVYNEYQTILEEAQQKRIDIWNKSIANTHTFGILGIVILIAGLGTTMAIDSKVYHR